ncbi:hypothetical protein ID866_7816 [Astraeus odoratus]|nr:hypothetical protein ID866_7816 [Astraeus odoratus]
MASNKGLNVSLETHLREALALIRGIAPADLSNDLAPYVSSEQTTTTAVPTIPYDILQRVSKWSQTPEGTKSLQDCSPSLDPQSYTMVALLAGTRTSPEKHFPPYAAKDPLEERRRAVDERKAISAVFNAVLSVAGTGAATWWASNRTGLGLEWRALLSVAAALIVALAETILYMIWESRRRSKPTKARLRHVVKSRKDGGGTTDDTTEDPSLGASTALNDSRLRHRIANPATATTL